MAGETPTPGTDGAAAEHHTEPAAADNGTGIARSTQATHQLAVARAGTMQQAFAGLMPTSIGEVAVLSQHLARSTAIPKGMRGQPDTVFTVIWAGMELGLTPIRSLQSISNISGTLCMKADLQLALTKNRQVLAFYDEGFERYGKTDTNLAKRLKLALGKTLRKLGATDQDIEDEVDLVVEKIGSATADGMKAGDPYGWAVAMRAGDQQIHVRTFTFADAEKAIIYEHDEANPGAPKERKPLSQKFNYKSFPGDMYPKRARTRLLQIVASDVTNGLPAVEQLEGGQVIDAEFTVSHHGDGDPGGDDVDTLVAAIRDEDAEAATTVEAGFKQLKMGKAAQLQKLLQFKGKPKDLVEWLRSEWLARGGRERHTADVLSGGDQKAEPAKPAAATNQGTPPIQDAQIIQDQPAETAKPAVATTAEPAVAAAVEQIERQFGGARDGGEAAADVKAAAEPMTPARDLAARFRRGGNLKTF